MEKETVTQLFRIRLWRCSKVFLSCFSFSTIEVSFWVKIVEVREKKVSKLTTSLGILISTLSTAKLGREMVGGSIFPHFSVKKKPAFSYFAAGIWENGPEEGERRLNKKI